MRLIDLLSEPDTSFGETPVLSEVETYLMVGCISLNRAFDGKSASKEVMSKLRLHLSSGDSSAPISMSCELLNHLIIPCSPDHSQGRRFSLSVGFDGQYWSDLIHLGVRSPGFRVNHAHIPGPDLMLCVTHDFVEIDSEIDLFIEQQDFLYNCMEIQEEIYLMGRGPEVSDFLQPITDEHKEVSDCDPTSLNHELYIMNSLIAKAVIFDHGSRYNIMFIFGEIVSFETPAHDSSVNEHSSIFIVFSVSGKAEDRTVISRGAIVKTPEEPIPKKVFCFNRPITQLNGQRLLVQVIQCLWKGGQSLVGYGFCDLDLNSNEYFREISVPLWRPKSPTEFRDRECGVYTPLSDPEIVTLPPYVDRKNLETVNELGRVRIHIQKTGYC